MDHHEAAALGAVTARLQRRFPDLDPGLIEEAVTRAALFYDDRPVRTFIPLLVEREVKDQLRAGRRTPVSQGL